jgi:hypothetical protein
MLKNSNDIHQATIFQVLQSHGKIDECIKFAEDVKSYETVIIHYINKQEYEKALNKVCDVAEDQARYEIMLRYSSVLLKKEPVRTIEALKTSKFKQIDIPKLIPAFMGVEKGKPMDEALKYVTNHCIKKKKSKDKTVHNLAFFFFSERDKPDELIEYLLTEEIRKSEGHAIHFEVDYALNVCK